MNKYEYFFNEFKELALLLGYKEKHFAGIADEEIVLVEQKYGIQFDACTRAYINFLGRKSLFSRYLFLFEDIHYAYKILNQFQDFVEIKQQTRAIPLNNSNGLIKPSKKEDFIFLSYDEIGSSYTFCLSNIIDDPLLYLYWQGGEIEQYRTITSLIRLTIFTQFESLASGRNVFLTPTIKGNKDKVKKIPWFNFYQALPKNLRNTIHNIRREYDIKIYSTRNSNDSLLSFDEYEIAFIKFLIEEKEVSYNPNQFNPYTPIVTFKEYLNYN